MSIIPELLNINNLRTTKAKSVNLHTIRKVIKYHFKVVNVEAMFTLKMLLLKGSLVLSSVQLVTGSERIKY